MQFLDILIFCSIPQIIMILSIIEIMENLRLGFGYRKGMRKDKS